MKTKEIQLFEFSELPEDIKSKVLERERYINTEDNFWHKYAIEEWEDKLKALGFNNPKISFSGFYSQGDGASFTCESVDIEKFLTAQKKKGKFPAILKAIKEDTHEVNVEIRRIDNHYSHEYTVSVDTEILYYGDDEPERYAALEREEGELRELVKDVARGLMRKIYRELEQEFDSLISDEAVIDTIEANEYTFRANGVMENS